MIKLVFGVGAGAALRLSWENNVETSPKINSSKSFCVLDFRWMFIIISPVANRVVCVLFLLSAIGCVNMCDAYDLWPNSWWYFRH